MLFRDWKKAIWKAPLHILLSAPVAAVSLIVPPLGKKYIAWRAQAEKNDEDSGRDTSEKATIDLYSQTALVKGAMRVYGIKE
jgi:hypothetical protein